MFEIENCNLSQNNMEVVSQNTLVLFPLSNYPSALKDFTSSRAETTTIILMITFNIKTEQIDYAIIKIFKIFAFSLPLGLNVMILHCTYMKINLTKGNITSTFFSTITWHQTVEGARGLSV